MDFIAYITYPGGGHDYYGPFSEGEYNEVVKFLKADYWEGDTDGGGYDGHELPDSIYVLPCDEDKHPLGDSDRAGEYFMKTRLQS